MLYWITTKDGHKYHLTSNAGLRGANLLGTFISLNDLQDLTSRGAELKSASQTITSPDAGDRWTGTHLWLDLAGVKLDVTLQPTGGNFYYGSSGGIQLSNRGPDPDGSAALPGWSWYWGNFHIGKGYYALWFYFESGEVLVSWSMEPNADGVLEIAFASVWHPNGWHEMLPVGPKSRASDIDVSPRTGVKYFNKFFLDLPARDAHFTFDKWVRDGELVPGLPEQRN
ncbi:unnamed protein product [Clonostachys chloroleuca]|uniref:Uncharacterized protein n=1 Tax=Clonostachys chloroleuca TaxID=1926264 RepID=A0AA35MAX9_9HYPO|nr:unnamed protein product [Clonostachys chloroleuca]